MRTFIVRHLIIVLAVVYFAAGAVITVEVLGFTGHLTAHGPASCAYDGYPVQAGQLLDPHGQVLACLEGQMVTVTFPGPLTASTMADVTPAQRTCAAFSAWRTHPTTARLTTLVIDSTRLGRSYLKADAGQLYADASSPSAKAAKYVSDDEQYVYEDCHNGYGL